MMFIRKHIQIIFLCGCVLFAMGCALAKTTGKAAWATAKVGSKVAWETTKVVAKGVKTTVNIINGKTVVPLRRQGNSMFVWVRLNRRVDTELVLDTGAAWTQISFGLARRLGIDVARGKDIVVRTADGRSVSAKQVVIRELRIGRAVVNHMPAVVLVDGHDKGYDGLLGMSFLNHFIFQIDSQKGELVLQNRVD